MKEDNERAKEQARAQLEGIMEMVADIDNENDKVREKALDRISEDPLSIEVRSGWHLPGQETKGGEYNILLCTGGPACRIIGDFNEYGEAESARLEYQDWFTPWIDYPLNEDEEAAVLKYAMCFYFGE